MSNPVEGITVHVSRNAIQDRRSHSRLPVFLDCEFVWGANTHMAILMDLSISGAFVSGRTTPPAKTPVKLVITAPKSKRELKFDGRVVRGGWFTRERVSHGFGIRFERITPDVLLLLKEVMAVSEAYLRESKVVMA